jgi:hypothetical protein
MALQNAGGPDDISQVPSSSAFPDQCHLILWFDVRDWIPLGKVKGFTFIAGQLVKWLPN